MKKCPYCAEEIQDDAIKCRHCGEFLEGKKTEMSTEEAVNRPPQQEEEKQIQCIYCKKMISIDATTCPYCGKTGGVIYSFALLGMILGLVASVLYFYFTTGMEDFFSSAMCGMCICNPIFWAFAIGGGIIGAIFGEIQKNKIKQQK